MKPKLSKEEKQLKLARESCYEDIYGECANLLPRFEGPEGRTPYYYEAIGITADRILYVGDREDLQRIIIAQGWLLGAIVRDIADIYSALGISLKKDEYAEKLGEKFRAMANERADKWQAAAADEKIKREERKARKEGNND